MYGEEGHYYTTYFVALRLGFPAEDARTLALYAQIPDELSNVDAVALEKSARVSSVFNRNDNSMMRRDVVHPGIHALAEADAQQETNITIEAIRRIGQTGDLRATGILIHRLGDTFSHRMLGSDKMPDPVAERVLYSPGMGHAAHGHTPDIIQRRPGLYLQYVDTLSDALGALRDLDPSEVERIRTQLRNELSKKIAVAAPISDKKGSNKSDGVLRQEALRGIKRLLRQENINRIARGEAALDLSYQPENSGPGLFDIRSTTTRDFGIALRVGFSMSNSSRAFGRTPATRTERQAFRDQVLLEMLEIDPAVLRAINELENAREAGERIREGQSAAVITEAGDATTAAVESN